MEKRRILSSPWFHLTVLLLGAAFFLTGAFHGNIWFDESYSVAIASKSFADIWTIGSGDVHPVLYYWALHTLWLAFGGDPTTALAAYRVFTVFGAVSTATLGLTHLRRDFGWKMGLVFTFFALFTPYISYMSIQVRMYSWATFAVMVTWIYAYRIIRRTLDGERIPVSHWLIFSTASLAAAYLHYFALISVFIINMVLIVFFINYHRSHGRDLVWCISQAVVEVLLYLPWIAALLSQLGVVSTTYWLKFTWPDSVYQIIDYPLATMQLSFAFKGSYGPVFQTLVITLLISFEMLLAYTFISWLWRRKCSVRPAVPPVPPVKHSRHLKDETSLFKDWFHRTFHPLLKRENFPAVFAVFTYLGLLIIVSVASAVIHSFMVYERYLFTCIGPLLFFVAWLVCRFDDKVFTAGLMGLVFALAVTNQVLIVHDDYNPANQYAQNYLAANVVSDKDPVLSSDIGIEGVTSLEVPWITQYYLDWQHANWSKAYECYSPTLVTIESWESILKDYKGNFWVMGTSNNTNPPRDVTDLEGKDGVSVISEVTFFRPYERVYFTIALMEKS